MFKGGTNTAALTRPHGINVSQSVYGKTVKLVYGMPQTTPDLVWYNDWEATDSPTNSALWLVVGGGSNGGKKSGKANKKSGIKYYSAAIDLVLGHAPIRNVLTIWYNNQKLAVVRAEAAGFVSGGQFSFTPDGNLSIVGVTHTIPAIPGPYVITVPNFVSDVNNVTANGVPLQNATYPPGAGQYNVDTAGNYSFNVAQAGQTAIINYRKLAAGGSATLAGVIGVTVAETYSETFSDYGNPNSFSVYGTWDRPLWDAKFAVPGRIDSGAYTARDPYSWWWDGVNPTIYFPPGLEGKPITVYYGVPVIYKSNGSFGTMKDTPLQLLNLEYEPAFASGAEYAAHPDEQIVQDWIAGLGSVRFDLGLANAMPNLNLETVGAFVQWPNGDCDVADAITDILASGPVLVQPQSSNPWA